MKYVLSVLGMIVFGVIAVILFSKTLNRTSQTAQQGTTEKNITDYINGKSDVQFTQYGQVVANENRRTLRINVSESQRKIEIIDGYQGTVSSSKTYNNNKEAYDVFMRSINNAGYLKEKKTNVSDPVGVCPNGLRYEYRLNDGANDISVLWNSSCAPQGGTIGGNTSLIRSLFQKQIPDYSTMVQGVTF